MLAYYMGRLRDILNLNMSSTELMTIPPGSTYDLHAQPRAPLR